MFCFVFISAHKHLVKLHGDNQYIIEGVYFNENQTPWTITDVVRMKKGFIAELRHHLLAKAAVCVRVSDSCIQRAIAARGWQQRCTCDVTKKMKKWQSAKFVR